MLRCWRIVDIEHTPHRGRRASNSIILTGRGGLPIGYITVDGWPPFQNIHDFPPFLFERGLKGHSCGRETAAVPGSSGKCWCPDEAGVFRPFNSLFGKSNVTMEWSGSNALSWNWIARVGGNRMASIAYSF